MSTYISICDYCCDNIGIVKEVFKTGGCTCEICGWSCHCALNTREHFVNSVKVNWISDDGWEIAELMKKRFDKFI